MSNVDVEEWATQAITHHPRRLTIEVHLRDNTCAIFRSKRILDVHRFGEIPHSIEEKLTFDQLLSLIVVATKNLSHQDNQYHNMKIEDSSAEIPLEDKKQRKIIAAIRLIDESCVLVSLVSFSLKWNLLDDDKTEQARSGIGSLCCGEWKLIELIERTALRRRFWRWIARRITQNLLCGEWESELQSNLFTNVCWTIICLYATRMIIKTTMIEPQMQQH